MTPNIDQLSDRVRELLDKQEIHEVLARYCRGLDRGDAELMRSTFHPDATQNQIGHVEPVGGLIEGLKRPSRNVLRALSHHISNVLTEVHGDSASSECYFLACHRLEHGGAEWTWIVGGRYLDRLERRDGAWRIANRTAVYDWARVDRIGERPDGLAIVAGTDNAIWGRTDNADASYTFAAGLD